MAKRLIWSPRAQNDRKEILKFWQENNKSKTYSKKLDLRFREAIDIIKEFPQSGKQTEDSKARIKVVKDYLLFYEESENEVVILTIWDNRQDPEKLKMILG
jgi:plasmid stabilization system protein ParE